MQLKSSVFRMMILPFDWNLLCPSCFSSAQRGAEGAERPDHRADRSSPSRRRAEHGQRSACSQLTFPSPGARRPSPPPRPGASGQPRAGAGGRHKGWAAPPPSGTTVLPVSCSCSLAPVLGLPALRCTALRRARQAGCPFCPSAPQAEVSEEIVSR